MASYNAEEYGLVCGLLDRKWPEGKIAASIGKSRSFVQRLAWIHELRQVEDHFRAGNEIPDQVLRVLTKAAANGGPEFGHLWTLFLSGQWDSTKKPAMVTGGAVYEFSGRLGSIIIVAPDLKAARAEFLRHLTAKGGKIRQWKLTTTTPLTVAGVLVSPL